jgi:hypothetical protein
MRAVFGAYDAWITPSFYVERDKKYDPDDPEVAAAMRKHPSAFTSNDSEIEQATSAPGERRNVRRD